MVGKVPDPKQQHGLLNFIRKLFTKSDELQNTINKKDEFDLEPEYWQEVIEFIETIDKLISSHTIEDSNIQQVNKRIVDYIKDQINVKGSIKNIEERYSALDTLADRILGNSFNKIVGLKHNVSSQAEFSEAVEEFKKRLHQRHQEEIVHLNQKQSKL